MVINSEMSVRAVVPLVTVENGQLRRVANVMGQMVRVVVESLIPILRPHQLLMVAGVVGEMYLQLIRPVLL